METRTYYFPYNTFGRHILNYVIQNVGCSVGSIRKVTDSLAVSITSPTREIVKIERILKTYDLM